MLCVPDLMSAYQQGSIDLDTVQAVQTAMIAHCELMGDRVAILDSPPGLNAQQIKEWRVDKARYDSMYAALYWPWIQTMNPATGLLSFMPPSGHIAGIWGRNDATRGVHKAPANEIVRGAIDLEIQLTRNEHDLLNPVGINCIRAFPGRGIRVWGARTLVLRPGVALPQRAAAVQLPGGVDPQRHQLGRLRAERPGPVGQDPAHHRRVPDHAVAGRRAVRAHPGRGLLRQVRLRDQPRRGHRRRTGGLRDRGGAGQAGGVRDLPARPVLRRRQPGQRVTHNPEIQKGRLPWLFPERNSAVGHSFGLEFDGITIKSITEVSGLKIEQDVVELKENGPDGKYVIHKLPGRPKAPDITLTRGLSEDNSFEKWVKDSQFGKMPDVRKGGAIIVYDFEGNADQALQADQRLAEEPGDRLAQGR